MAKECEKTVCRNCNQEGHLSRDCDQPNNPANTKCRNCDEMGHFSRDCPKPRDYSRVQCQNCGESELSHPSVLKRILANSM
jgi:Zinc knuckle